MQVLLAQGAEDDVSAILSFYGESSLKAAEFAESLEDAIAHVARYPETSTRRHDLTRPDVFWLFYSHWLVLKKRPDSLLIVGVHHCARRLRLC